jgi:alkaline phosphatase D
MLSMVRNGVRRKADAMGRAILVLCYCALWFGSVPNVVAAEPVVAAPLASSTVLQRIAFGSCLDQRKPQPIWRDVLATQPQLLLMMGDNVYGDFEDADALNLRKAYEVLGQHAEFAPVRASVPILPIWDDHDLGRNDGGADFPHKALATKLFHDFWGAPSERPMHEGLHMSRTYGPDGQKVQIIMLDMRTFRSPLQKKSPAWSHNGQYEPISDPARTFLGDAQWSWLEAELKKPADVRVIVSSIQVLAEGHGWERWGNLPLESQRLKSLIGRINATSPVILLSGDRHFASFYSVPLNGRDLVELTASSFNIRLPFANTDTRMPPLASDIFSVENFGTLTIDWSARTLDLALIALGGAQLATRQLPF